MSPNAPKPSQNPKNSKEGSSLENKMKDSIKNLKESDLYHYASSNKEQTATYILLAIGIILLFLNLHVGSFILGAVAGYHFSNEIVSFLRNLTQIFEGWAKLRNITLLAILVALLISIPGLVIGALIVAALKQLLFPAK